MWDYTATIDGYIIIFKISENNHYYFVIVFNSKCMVQESNFIFERIQKSIKHSHNT